MTNTGTAKHACELLSVSDLSRLLRISKRSIWRLVALGKFPQPVRLGPKMVRWRAREVDAYLSRVQEQ